MHPPAPPLDPDEVFAATLTWTADEQFTWLAADYNSLRIFLRLNTSFPDEPLYSILVDEDATVEFDDFPATWTRWPLEWSEPKRA